jgi:hypothetical protein
VKEFSELRTALTEGLEDLTEHVTMPPQILILRRVTVRQFANETYVALYKNDRLGLTFSIPYGDQVGTVITPVSEAQVPSRAQWRADFAKGLEDVPSNERAQWAAAVTKSKNEHKGKIAKLVAKKPVNEDDEYLSHPTSRAGKAAQKTSWMANFEKHVTKAAPQHTGKINWNDAHYHHSQGTDPQDAARKYVTSHSEHLNEDHDPIGVLRGIRDGHAMEHVKHHDGTKTRVDHVTAHALLTVHDALSPDNQKKMSDAIGHSKAKFHRIVDFAWKQVK